MATSGENQRPSLGRSDGRPWGESHGRRHKSPESSPWAAKEWPLVELFTPQVSKSPRSTRQARGSRKCRARTPY